MDQKKLIEFVEAILPNPDHIAYTLGLRHNAALQYYAVNVNMLNTITPDLFIETAEKLFGEQLKNVEAVRVKCEQLAEQAGVKVSDLTNSKMFSLMLTAFKESTAKPTPEPVAAKTDPEPEPKVEAEPVAA